MLKVQINKFSVQAAENWNELNLNQLLDLTDLLFNQKFKLKISEFKFAALNIILNIKRKPLFAWNFFQLDRSHIVTALFPITDFITKNELTDFKIKSFRIWFTRYYAPADNLDNITIDEFRFLDSMYVNYKKTGQESFLDGMVAILYRRKRKDFDPRSPKYKGDIREDFNENLIIRNSRKVEKLSLKKKQLILLSYEGSRNKQIQLCDHLFSDREKSSGKSFGFGGILLELSGTKFGDYEKTCKTNWKTAFNYLEMEAVKHENQPRK